VTGDTAAPGSGRPDPGPFLPDPDPLLRLHAETLFDIDGDGRLVATNEPEPEPAPRLFLVRGRSGRAAWFGGSVPADTAARCLRAVAALPAWDGEEPPAATYDDLRAALAADAPLAAETSGVAFAFGERAAAPAPRPAVATDVVLVERSNAHLLAPHFPYTRTVLDARSPVAGVVRDGVVVAACSCARKRATACEAGVATAEAYRGAGLAAAAVLAWREAVEAAGAVPLYSTEWENRASRRLAEKLGLVAYATTWAAG
jgi:hypothetical protein